MAQVENRTPQFRMTAVYQGMLFVYAATILTGFVLGGVLFAEDLGDGGTSFSLGAALGIGLTSAVLALPAVLVLKALQILVDQRAELPDAS